MTTTFQQGMTVHTGINTRQEPLMLKPQLTLNLNGSHKESRLWDSIPERCRQQVIEHLARLIGNAARGESKTGALEENNDEYDSKP